MADVPISNLTDATTVNSTDELPIVQSGVTKRATIAELSAAITPADASTSTKGIARLATNADVAAGIVTDEIVTPAGLRHGLANSAATSIIVNSATGTTNTGDVNITGEFKVNGTALASTPAGTPVAFTSATEVAFAVDFTTYSAYDLMVRFTGGGSSALDLVASSNSGSSYATSVFENFRSAGVTNTTKAEGGLMGSRGVTSRTMLNAVLYQPLTTSDVNVLANVQSDMATSGNGTGITGGYMPVTAACNYLKLTFPNTNSGYYILTPRAKR